MKNHVLLYHDHSSSLILFTRCSSSVAIKEATEMQATGEKYNSTVSFLATSPDLPEQ